MRALAVTIALLAASVPTQAMLFGMDTGSVEAQAAAGVAPDVGTLWVGPWNLEAGWLDPAADLERLREAAVMPVVHLYYWGDDISRACLEDGCQSELHGVRKDRAGWNATTEGLLVLLEALDGLTVVVLLETEFNKVGPQTSEVLDTLLAEKARQIKGGYPEATVVLPFGNWNRAAWADWDEAASASDAIGVQAMRASTRHTPAEYRDAYEETLAGAQAAQRLFGKPVWVHDIAMSTYGGDEGAQAAELSEFFDGRSALQAAGVEGLVYRSWHDTGMSTANYFGEAERHWGLARGGDDKPAARIWTAGVSSARMEDVPAPQETLPIPPGPERAQEREPFGALRRALHDAWVRWPSLFS